VSDIAKAVHRVAKRGGYDVVEEYVGHGIGLAMHEEPDIHHRYPFSGHDARLRAGMCIAIEPILTIGDAEVFTEKDGWTVRTTSGNLAAHVEHTVAITPDGPVVLTLP
jgi:methionyl aminopeptidase